MSVNSFFQAVALVVSLFLLGVTWSFTSSMMTMPDDFFFYVGSAGTAWVIGGVVYWGYLASRFVKRVKNEVMGGNRNA